jgi:hypothetical protein
MLVHRFPGGGAVRATVASLLVLAVMTPSFGQRPPTPTRIRGAIESVDGDFINIKSRSGELFKVHLSRDARVVDIVKISLADIKQGSYVGATGMPQPDGSQKALEVHVFPEAQRGTGEGFRPFDLQPNSTMTNATVTETVVDNDGKTLTVKYKDGEKKIIVSADTPVVTYESGQRSELIAGAKIIATVAAGPDGALELTRVSVGRDGLTPPM